MSIQRRKKEIYGILAYPAKNSLSPTMHNAAFKWYGMNASYNIFETPPKKLASFIDTVRLSSSHIRGLSISIPYKETIMHYLDKIDKTAKSIGAVNTIINQQGKLCGTNTDWLGVIKALDETGDILKNRQNIKALLLGAGGAARAAIYALIQQGISVTILNRTRGNAQMLAQKFHCEGGSLDMIKHLSPHIVINATSVGLYPHDNESLVPRSFWKKNMIAFDLVYIPQMTQFLRDAQQAGCAIITGERMLLYQAAAQFELWTKKEAPIKVMEREEALKTLT